MERGGGIGDKLSWCRSFPRPRNQSQRLHFRPLAVTALRKGVEAVEKHRGTFQCGTSPPLGSPVVWRAPGHWYLAPPSSAHTSLQRRMEEVFQSTVGNPSTRRAFVDSAVPQSPQHHSSHVVVASSGAAVALVSCGLSLGASGVRTGGTSAVRSVGVPLHRARALLRVLGLRCFAGLALHRIPFHILSLMQASDAKREQ